MAHLYFTRNLARQISCPEAELTASSIAQLFDQYFSRWPEVRGYVLDDQGALRKHIRVVVDGLNVRDRQHLSDALGEDSEVYVFQALSGG
jgi:hypothetical protein